MDNYYYHKYPINFGELQSSAGRGRWKTFQIKTSPFGPRRWRCMTFLSGGTVLRHVRGDRSRTHMTPSAPCGQATVKYSGPNSGCWKSCRGGVKQGLDRKRSGTCYIPAIHTVSSGNGDAEAGGLGFFSVVSQGFGVAGKILGVEVEVDVVGKKPVQGA